MGALTRRWHAPGRVNLIGDHTDYNEGLVLPVAIDLGTTVEGDPSDRVRIRSAERAGVVELPADGSVAPGEVDGWGGYVAGVVRTLAELGRPAVGIDAVVTSTVPLGAGLSSSAALEVALAVALCDVAGFQLAPLELALACQSAEQAATGVPCGIMDQLASVAGRAGHALLIDCRDLSVDPIPLPDELAILVVDSATPRALAASAYAERRAACERAAARLGLGSLRDATATQVADDPRARHVVAENERVRAAAAALASGELEALGPLLHASHASLRDDFEVSTPELDRLVEALEEAGALGARLTGAGFGGAAVALVRRVDAGRVAETACRDYRAATGNEPRPFLCRAVAGAGILAG